MARLSKAHVVVTVDTSKLDAAIANYRRALEELASITPCLSYWPSDPPDQNYLGTRCQLLEGHEGEHRHRMLGSQTVVTW